MTNHGASPVIVKGREDKPGPSAQVPLDHFDGLDRVDDLPRDGRCVADYWF